MSDQKTYCNCINDTTEALRKKIKEDVEGKYNVSEWTEEGDYAHKGWSMSGGPTRLGMPFVAKYIRKKVNGEPEKRETTVNVSIYPTFCPFCGIKLVEEKEEGGEDAN